jgi:hypothetical protein
MSQYHHHHTRRIEIGVMLPTPLLDPPIGACAPLDELVLDAGLAGQEVPAHHQQCR